MTSSPLLTVRNLSRSFGKLKAVDNISFQLERGKVIGLIGANGAGKTTPMRMLATLDFPDSGEIIINGTNDLCTPLVAKTMYDSIPNSRWELFADCRHACFVEDTDRYCRLLNEWMDQND